MTPDTLMPLPAGCSVLGLRSRILPFRLGLFLIRSSSSLKCSQCTSILCLNSLNIFSTTALNSLSSNCLFLLRCLLYKGFLLLFPWRAVSLPFHLLNSSVSMTVGESYPLRP